MSRPRVFLDVNIGEEPVGRLVIELFVDQAPKTCENFRQLCTGEHNDLSYAKSPFHRVIDEFMIQGGDIKNGDGTGVTSIYGAEFDDENISWRDIDGVGLVCAANRGPDTNGSQFFITLESCEHLNGKHTVFGRMVSGEDTLQRISKVKVDDNDRPLQPVLVSRCGELERKSKQRQPAAETGAQPPHSRDRGRHRRSNEMSVTPPRPDQRNRRQSDNVVDEGLRGRPRARSRSGSGAVDETDEASGMESPVSKHKRKRSPVPSRHVESKPTHEDESAHEQRRRRSLPNQYRNDRVDRTHADEDRYRPSPRRDGNRYAGGSRDEENQRRRGDHYRPRNRELDDGRLGGEGKLGGGGGGGDDAPVKFKGRGAMKYREPGRL